jgi:integrase/recombinase XerD
VKVAACVELYVERNQKLGYAYTGTAKVLRRFANFVGNIEISRLRNSDVSDFLTRGSISNNTWRYYRSHLHRFFVYWFARRQMRQMLEPEQRPATLGMFFPYVYTRAEIRRLLAATSANQRFNRCILDAPTFRTLILFLYGTGIGIGDVLRLTTSDIDFTNRTLRIRASAPYLSRSVPLGTEVADLLVKHLHNRNRQLADGCDVVFASNVGHPLRYAVVCHAFRQLRKLVGIKRANSSYQPRIQDLKHTFAVHSIAKWICEKRDLGKMVPMLATYMGRIQFDAMDRYLELSPERYLEQLGRMK